MSRPLTAFSLLAVAVVVAGCSLEDAPLIGHPAATTDGHSISMTDYRARLKVENDFYTNTRTDAQKQDIAIRSLVDEALVADEAKNRGLTVTDDEVNKEIDFQRTVYERFSALQRAQHPERPAPPAFNTFLRSEGYDVDKLRESVRLILLEQKVQHKQAQNRADAAYREIQGGLSISDAAKKYSDANSAPNGGLETLSSIDQATSDTKLTPTLNTLQPGDSSKVVEGSSGFFIIKLLTRTDTAVTADVVYVRAPAATQYAPKLRPQWFIDFVKGLENTAHVRYYVGPKAT